MSKQLNVRSNIDEHHKQWVHAVQKVCSDIGVEPSLLRLCYHQIHCSTVPADTPSGYYCCSVSIPLLDHLLSEIESRFSTHQQIAMLGLSLIPSFMASLGLEECTAKVSQLAKMYEEDLPSPECIEGKLHCWWVKWQQEHSLNMGRLVYQVLQHTRPSPRHHNI